MEEKYKEIIAILTKEKQTISTMESCTGGGVANAITNTDGASQVLKFSAVTYSNEFKIKMGVSSDIIDTYTVYSMETAKEMAYHIHEFTASTFGIGITGKINREDKTNMAGDNNKIYVSIYSSIKNEYYPIEIEAIQGTRKVNKERIIEMIADKLLEIIK